MVYHTVEIDPNAIQCPRPLSLPASPEHLDPSLIKKPYFKNLNHKFVIKELNSMYWAAEPSMSKQREGFRF